jgi:hypothetical protein
MAMSPSGSVRRRFLPRIRIISARCRAEGELFEFTRAPPPTNRAAPSPARCRGAALRVCSEFVADVPLNLVAGWVHDIALTPCTAMLGAAGGFMSGEARQGRDLRRVDRRALRTRVAWARSCLRSGERARVAEQPLRPLGGRGPKRHRLAAEVTPLRGVPSDARLECSPTRFRTTGENRPPMGSIARAGESGVFQLFHFHGRGGFSNLRPLACEAVADFLR